jgi:hypothetical protein
MATPLPLIVVSDDSVNPSLQKTIFTNINDNTNQDISAADVRDTISAVVQGTYSMKTIWAGYVYIDNRDAYSTNSRGGWYIWEQYCDPNYFIMNEEPDSYTNGRKYQVVDSGTGLTLGDYKGISTTSLNGEGYGLTFNFSVVSGGIYNLQVVNQGTGYFSRTTSWHSGGTNSPDDEIVELNIPTSGTKPRVRINLRNTLRLNEWNSSDSVLFSNDWAYNTLKITLLQGKTRFKKLRNILPVWTDTMGKDRIFDRSMSRIDWPDTTTWETSQYYSNPDTTATFYLAQQYSSTVVVAGTNVIRGYLELKAPIV